MSDLQQQPAETAGESRRGRPREFDRDEVLDRAVALFWEGGYQGTPISELVERLGIARQSLYLAFGGKRQLFEEALRRYAGQELAPMHRLLRAPGSPLANVRALIGYWQERAVAGDFRGCLINTTVAELGSKDAELAAVLEQSSRGLEDDLTANLRRAREAGEIPADKDPRAIARLLISAAQGMILWAPVRRSRAWVKDVGVSMRRLLE